KLLARRHVDRAGRVADRARTTRQRATAPRERARDVQAARSETLAGASRRSPDRHPGRDPRLTPASASPQQDDGGKAWVRAPSLPSLRLPCKSAYHVVFIGVHTAIAGQQTGRGAGANRA